MAPTRRHEQGSEPLGPTNLRPRTIGHTAAIPHAGSRGLSARGLGADPPLNLAPNMGWGGPLNPEAMQERIQRGLET